MLFISLPYLIFLPLTVLLHRIIPYRLKWLFLLFASYFFYGFQHPWYPLLLVFATVVSYLSGIKISATASTKRRKLWLAGGIVSSLSMLAVFKYAAVITAVFSRLTGLIQPDAPAWEMPGIILPLGISFFTFQSLSYVIDVYRNDVPAEKHFGYFALYLSFFPQLVAGPIERPSVLLPRLKSHNKAGESEIREGAIRIVTGLFKKMIIADNLSLILRNIYDDPAAYTHWPLALAVILFAVQVYCDFSGYTDIAIGSALFMGIRLTENFRQPFFSRSMSEFWSRWHITLSSWFRDYVFYPAYKVIIKKIPQAYPLLSRHKLAYSLSSLLAMLLLGAWHGAGLKFLIMGAVFGLVIITEQSFVMPLIKKLRIHPAAAIPGKAAAVLITFLIFSFTTVFFRAGNTADAITIISGIFRPITAGSEMLLSTLGQNLHIPVFFLFILAADLIERRYGLSQSLLKIPLFPRWLLYSAVLLSILLFGNLTGLPFVYFVF